MKSLRSRSSNIIKFLTDNLNYIFIFRYINMITHHTPEYGNAYRSAPVVKISRRQISKNPYSVPCPCLFIIFIPDGLEWNEKTEGFFVEWLSYFVLFNDRFSFAITGSQPYFILSTLKFRKSLHRKINAFLFLSQKSMHSIFSFLAFFL